ncbi:MAG: aminoacetone oxidase family FAD-binding enzyme [Oscillospiraceae bacterium]|nr:aminoacetone oxidase family FAD-binding enzyme [Oscillospiraceae bacterium]
MKHIIVLGGGAGGMLAAIKAAEDKNVRVTLLEQMDRVGKKVLATGNGRCNLSNANIDSNCYFSENTKLADQLVGICKEIDVVGAFNKMGLLCEEKEMGRIYPKCAQASMVLDILLAQLERSKIEVKCGVSVCDIQKAKQGFVLRDKQGEKYTCDKLIVACGGKASANLGSDGSCYPILKKLGHSLTTLYPCLVPLKSDEKALRALKGIRAVCGVNLYANGKFVAKEVGEVQFADYGLSGIPLMQLSCYCKNKEDMFVSIDLFEETDEGALAAMLFERRSRFYSESSDTLLLGTVNKRLAAASVGHILKSLPKRIGDISDAQIISLAHGLKNWKVTVSGPLPYNRAQVTGGGIPLGEIDLYTMESRVCSGLYLCGEVLDMVGLCGGYNLHFAFATGILAGKNASKA